MKQSLRKLVKAALFFAVLFTMVLPAFAQGGFKEPVSWTYSVKMLDQAKADIIISAKIDEG